MKKLLTLGFLTILVWSGLVWSGLVWSAAQTARRQQQPARDPDTNNTPARRSAQTPAAELWRQVEIIRTAHGVPHIRAENLRAAGYALAWLQSEDYGPRTAMNVLEAR